MDDSHGPLSGVRVADFSQTLAGPFCTMILADLGADVVKIEPLTGDPARRIGPFMVDDADRHYGGYFQSINRNKRSVAIDLNSPAANEAVRSICLKSDVVVENFRLGVMRRFGLNYESLAADQESIVYASIRGFGDRAGGVSDRIEWPAFDLNAQALGGLMSITGDGTVPLKAGPGLGDIVPGLFCAIGILSALTERTEHGRGQYVDISMYDSVIAVCERIIHQYSYTEQTPRATGNEHPLLMPFEVLSCMDGWITLASVSAVQWTILCDAVGDPRLRDDRYQSESGRLEHAPAIRSVLSEWTAVRTRAQVIEQLGGVYPVGEVQDAADIFGAAHVAAREMLATVEHPGSARQAVIAGSPIKLSGHSAPNYHRAPLLGEHTVDVLSEIGVAPHEFAGLVRAGAVLADDTITRQ